MCPCVSRSTKGGGGFPQRRREARRIILYRTSAALFFLGGRQKGEKRLSLKNSIEVNKNTKFPQSSFLNRSDIDFQSSVGGVFKLEKGRAVREFEKRRVCARVFMQQQRALLLSLSLSLLMMMMMMQKRVSAIDKRTQSEERGFRDLFF